jgi:hexosaminidase
MYDVKGYNYATHIFDVEGEVTTDTVKNAVVVTLRTVDDAPIYYTLDGTEPTTSSLRYRKPVSITGDVAFKAKGIGKRGATRMFEEHLSFNKATGKPITLLQPAHRSYTYGGALTLVDGLKGSRNYRTGRWLGFAGNDCELLIDLQQPTEISSVSLSTCVEKGDWIFDARGFSVYTSMDGANYTEVYSEQLPSMDESDANGIANHTLSFTATEARYVKVKVLVERAIPEWHGARGYAGFLFIDEVAIN